MVAGVAAPSQVRKDGDRIQAPGDTWLPCQACGSKMRFLTAHRGRALCRSCIAFEVVRG